MLGFVMVCGCLLVGTRLARRYFGLAETAR
jgi:hypothetical protein